MENVMTSTKIIISLSECFCQYFYDFIFDYSIRRVLIIRIYPLNPPCLCPNRPLKAVVYTPISSGLSLEYRRFSIAFISSCCSEYNKGSVSAMLASSAALIGVSSFTCCCRFSLSVASSEDFRSVPFSLEVFPESPWLCLSRMETPLPPAPSLRFCPESLVPRCEASDVF